MVGHGRCEVSGTQKGLTPVRILSGRGSETGLSTRVGLCV